MFPVPHRRDVPRPPHRSSRLGGCDLPHGGARRLVDGGGGQASGRLTHHRCRAEAGVSIETVTATTGRLGSRERTMRELVAEYLSKKISRRGFVGGLTKAGLTASAAQSVLTAVATVSYGQGA